MAQLMNIRLSRFDAQPWGFRLQGGKDFGTPLVVQKVNGGSLAEQAGLLAGDSVIKVNNLDVFNMRHKDAQDFIVRSGNTFDLTIQRGGGVWRPAITPTGSLPSPSSHIGNNISPVTKTSLSHRPQEVHHIGSGYNNAARPFSSVNGNDGQVKSIVNKQYNTPVGIYSEEAIAETLSAQAEVLAGGVLGVNFKKNEKIYSGANSEVLKMLHEQENEPEPASDYQQQSQPQQQQHQQHQQQLHSPNVTKHVNAPIDRPIAPNTGGLPTGQNICTECERLIVGVFVRIKDKNLHAECFKCATCGTNLKNQGYYNFNNKLYCEIHARMAAMNNPPKGTEGYTPVPIKPTAKLSANTISAALDAHTHHQYNGSSNHETSHHTHSRNSSTSSSIGGNSSSTTTTTSSLSPNKSISSPEKLSPSHSRQSSENGGSTILMPGHPPPLQHQYPHYPSTISPTLSSPPPPPPLPPEISQTVAPPSAGGIIHSSEIVINHKANGNDTTPAASNARKYQNQQQRQQHNGYNNGGEHPMNNGRNNGMPINNGGNDDGDVAGRNGHSPTMADNRNGVGSGSGPSDLPSVLSPATVYNQFLKIYANKIQNDFLDGGSGIDTKKSPTKIATAEIAEKINESTENRSIKMTSTPLPVTSYTENLDSIYGTIRPKNMTKNPDEEFQYVTLDGSVIRSVVAPGKGIKTNYKLNTGYGGPKPFNTSSPMSPQMRGPQSPSTYPPPTNMQNWDQPRSQPSRPQTNPYATLPRSAGSQEENQQQNYAAEQEHHDRSIFEEDIELIEANRPLAGHFAWPPPSEEDRNTPTATPLYIAPPETQHIVPKTLTTQQQQQWQSRSAPELAITSGQQKQVEIESSSDSYTSTSTTTTTTSEEYHRMYQAQVQAYQMQQAYEQYGSEMDYHMDIDLAAMHQDQSYSSAMDYYSSGRRSAHECVDYLAGPVSTYHLIDMVRAVTPKPDTPPLKATKKVEFSDEIQVKKEERIVPIQTEVTETQTENEDTIEQRFEETDEQNVDELRVQPVSMEELTDHRKFTATPEIKIEIPPVKSIPPTNIPNPVPKEWISPMVRALTTAPDKPVEIPESLAELTVVESAQFKEEKTVKFQDPPENQDETVAVKPEVLRESPPKGSFIARTMTTAPKDSVQFASKLDDTISLPEETEPYMPPPMDMKPYYREDYRPKSPFLTALTVAPDRPYTPYNKQDVCSQLLDLPNPKEKLTMVDALTVASTRCYTPLNPENAATLIEEEKSKKSTYEFFSQQENEVIECQIQKSDMEECNRQLSAFANVNGSNGLCPFQPRRESLTSTASNVIPPARHNSLVPSVQNLVDQRDSLQSPFCRSTKMQSISSNHCHQKSEHSMHQSCASSTKTISYNGMTHKQTHHAMAAEHKNSQETEQKLSFPPPPPPPPPPQPSSGHKKTTYSSGLHKPESIPQYQRNWTVLPSQRPVRTPEPPELRENVPLAFIETPRELTPSIDPSPITVPIINSTTTNATTALAQHNLAAFTATKASEQPQQQYQKIEKPKATLPIIVTENSTPVTMAFQSLDVPHEDAHPRPFTPSLINKPAPIIPFYQTPEKLVFEECPIATGRAYDPLAPSPLPDRARSPAPGPPPNPLSAIRAPRMKDTEPSYRPTQQGSITTGQSYFGTTAAQYQTQECGQTVSHCQTGYQSGSQKFIDRPESVQLKKIGDTLIQTRSKESQLSEENRSATQTTSTSQVGNMQIERRRKVVEEFEHTQTAKSMEIRTGHEQTSKGHYGKTGFVANQTRRLSGLEQEISSMSSQSQAISARAANLSSPTTIFPHYKSPEPVSMFPLKTAMPPNDEPQRPAYVVSANATNKMVSGPPSTEQTYTATNMGSRAYPHATLSTTATYGAAQRSITSATSQYSSSAAAASSFDVSSLNNFSSSASAPPPPSKLTNPPSVPAYKPPVPFSSVSGPSNLDTAGSSYSQPLSLQQPGSFLTTNQQPPAPQSTNSVAFTPTTISSSAVAPAPNESSAYKAPPPPSSNSFTPNVVNDSSAASAGPSKSGAFGATSAPKRGRGILNKAVGPGGRVPMCGCCQRQIRGPFITALGRIWCPEHFVCVNANCRRALQDIGFVEEKGELYCEFCFEKYLAPTCSRCNGKIKGDCLNAIGKHYHPECFTCSYCGRLFGNRPFFLEEGEAYCEADWNELFTTKCFACGFPVEAGDRWVEALNHNYHSQCFNCTMCKKNLEGQSFYNKGGRPFCKNHAR